MNKIKFPVVGTQYYDFADKIGIPNSDYEETAKYLKENYDDGDIIYEYDFGPSKVELIPEPDNEHDPNAIAVHIDGAKVGHIKKESTSYAREFLDNPKFARLDAVIEGGKYKQLYEDEDGKLKIEKDQNPYYIDVYVYLKEDNEPTAPVASYIKEDVQPDPERPKLEPAKLTKIVCLIFSLFCLFAMIKVEPRGNIFVTLLFLALAIIFMLPVIKRK